MLGIGINTSKITKEEAEAKLAELKTKVPKNDMERMVIRMAIKTFEAVLAKHADAK